jgi:hypothetical protein
MWSRKVLTTVMAKETEIHSFSHLLDRRNSDRMKGLPLSIFEKTDFPIDVLCNVVSVSRSAYYL